MVELTDEESVAGLSRALSDRFGDQVMLCP
jgi:hypothetical protein